MAQVIEILLVEDDPAHVELILRGFERSAPDCRVTAATTLQAARVHLAGHSPQLIVADWRLPDGDGLAFITELQGRSAIPVVVMTSHGNERLAVEALKAGALDYVVKSVETMSDMPHIARRALDLWRHREERERTLRLLRAEEARYRLLAENLTDVVWTLDLGLKITYISPSVERLTGWTIAESAALRPEDYISSRSLPMLYRIIQEERVKPARPAGGPDVPVTIELEQLCKDGRTIWTETSARFMRDASGAQVGILGVTRDITARRQAEEALRRERAYLQALLSSMADGVLVISADETVASCNQRALDMLGYDRNGLVGVRLGQLLAGLGRGDEPARELRAELCAGTVTDYDTELLRRDGGTVPVSISCAPMPGEPGRQELVLVARDIRSRRFLQAEQIEYSRRLEKEVAEEARRVEDYAEIIRRTVGTGGELVGRGAAYEKILQFVRECAGAPSPVLIMGESGTGKEIVARAIHLNSPRAERPFVLVDCSTLHETLLESELFGHEKGAFTGAAEVRKGLAEIADGGTLFVDEIGEMPPELQAKLLRVLEKGEFRRLGSTVDRRVDLRVIAATNRDLAAEVKRRRFRGDLFYRLNVLAVTLPPLRERREDIAPLAEHFTRNGRVTAAVGKRLSEEALGCLEAYAWPGNVRELANIVERAMILSGREPGMLPSHLPPEVRSAMRSPAAQAPAPSLEQVEREAVERALEQCKGNRSAAARVLGVSRPTMLRMLKRHGLH